MVREFCEDCTDPKVEKKVRMVSLVPRPYCRARWLARYRAPETHSIETPARYRYIC